MIQTAVTDSSVSHVFIPRRDRFARPEDPLDAMKLENSLRGAGLTLVFFDRVVPPLERGRPRDVGELIVAMLEYNSAGEFRRELAQKMIHAQISLARAGFSTGGRPPFGFRRWLASADGTPVRELGAGESVRRAGHHVVWLPGPAEEQALIGRILQMLESKPASQVAKVLTSEGIPPPDAGRYRTDRGLQHPTSGVWHQTTITNIARNPLLLAVTTFGRRSMGDQLRFTPDGPRCLRDADLRNDGQPKVIANPETNRIVSKAKFEPLVDQTRHERLLQELERRSGSQRGKSRSRTPGQNPLGCRVFDMHCGWPMYREPHRGSFCYRCGLYQQSHGARCHHHLVDGISATRFVLGCVRQRLLTRGFRGKLEKRLRDLAERDRHPDGIDHEIATKRASLAELTCKRELVAQNLALAENPAQHQAVAKIFEQVAQEHRTLELQLEQAERLQGTTPDLEAEISAALSKFDRLADLAADPSNLEAIGDLFRQVNARLFLRFAVFQPKKRKLNKVAGGVLTFGTSPAPISLYMGPTGRRALGGMADTPDCVPAVTALPPGPCGSDREGKSLGNVNRAERR
jgi:hypothetical protein